MLNTSYSLGLLSTKRINHRFRLQEILHHPAQLHHHLHTHQCVCQKTKQSTCSLTALPTPATPTSSTLRKRLLGLAIASLLLHATVLFWILSPISMIRKHKHTTTISEHNLISTMNDISNEQCLLHVYTPRTTWDTTEPGRFQVLDPKISTHVGSALLYSETTFTNSSDETSTTIFPTLLCQRTQTTSTSVTPTHLSHQSLQQIQTSHKSLNNGTKKPLNPALSQSSSNLRATPIVTITTSSLQTLHHFLGALTKLRPGSTKPLNPALSQSL